TKKIKLGNFELSEIDGKLQIRNKDSQTVATIDENGNTNLAGNITAPDSELNTSTPSAQTNPPTDTTQASGSSRLAKLMSDEIETKDLTATGSTKLAQLMAEEASVSGTLTSQDLSVTRNATIAGETKLGQLVADSGQIDQLEVNATTTNQLKANQFEANQAQIDELNTNQAQLAQADVQTLNAQNVSISGELVAGNSRLEYLESQLAYLDEVNANTAKIVQGQFETATVSGTLYANNIDGFEDKVADAFRQPSLLGTLLDQDNTIDTSDVIAEVEAAGYNASGSAQLKQSLADLELAQDDIVISPKAAYIKDYLQVNGSGYISDSLGVNNYLVMGDGLKIQAKNGIASINYLSTSDPASTTLALQPSGVGRINLLAGTMVLDDTGRVMINGDLNIAGNLDVDGDIRTKDTLLTNLIQPDDFDQPTQIKLATRSAQTEGQVAGANTDSGEIKESRLEIINESGTPVATISATGRADFSDGLGVDQEDLTATDSAEVETKKTSGKAKITQGQTELVIKSEKITKDSQIFVTPLGSTDDQVLYVKSQTAENSLTSEKEGQFIVGFDQETNKDVKFNWWIIN
ncbi:MAG: hypothetical protein U9O78_02675, partial [Patescibacteria group bacterium]|nr:hypothetical protein [Patescibacteria group bacterium]